MYAKIVRRPKQKCFVRMHRLIPGEINALVVGNDCVHVLTQNYMYACLQRTTHI
jgi:hypothetical protein